MFKIFSTYICRINTYNATFRGQRCGTTPIRAVRRQRVKRSTCKQYSPYTCEGHTVTRHENTRSSLPLTSALDGDKWSTPRPGRFYLTEWTGNHFTGEWMGAWVGLDGYGNSRPHRYSMPGPSSPLTSRYTFSAIPAIVYICIRLKYRTPIQSFF